MSEELAIEPASDAAPETKVDDAKPESSPAKEDTAIEKMQKRIDTLTWRLKENERRSAQQVEPESKPPASETLKRPTKADFNFDEDQYDAAIDQYYEKRAEQIAERKLTETLTKREQEATARANEQSFDKRQADFIKEHPEYREKVQENLDLPVSNVMGPIMRRSEMGPAIALYLSDNIEKAEAIYQLTDPVEVAREIGRIEALLEKKPAEAKAPVEKTSKAPPPVPKIEASDPVIEKDPANMSDSEFRKWREKSIAQRRRR